MLPVTWSVPNYSDNTCVTPADRPGFQPCAAFNHLQDKVSSACGSATYVKGHQDDCAVFCSRIQAHGCNTKNWHILHACRNMVVAKAIPFAGALMRSKERSSKTVSVVLSGRNKTTCNAHRFHQNFNIKSRGANFYGCEFCWYPTTWKVGVHISGG